MSKNAILPDTGAAPDGSSMALLRIPFVFTQDKLLSTGDFISEAKERGYSLTLEDLESLYKYRLLIPMFRIGDVEVESRRISARTLLNDQRVFEAACTGRIYDSAFEEPSAEWPFALPEGESVRGWWNGFLYSSWQLPDLKMALNDHLLIKQGLTQGANSVLMESARRRSIVLAALATKYLPGILGSMTLPLDGDDENLWQFKHKTEVADLLRVAGFDKERLESDAILLLENARARDPMKEWWPLIRHSNKDGWEKLAGVPRDCIWQRIAAEILLRAHEELSAKNQIDPLMDLTGLQVRHPLHDRISPRELHKSSMELELSAFGLSPHPRVLLLLEGQTEMIHVPKLLSEIGLDQPNRVRVQNCRSSKINPQLISRYAITPRIGPERGTIRLVTPPTALVVAMDPEGRWSSQAKRENERRKLQKAIREDLEWQYKANVEKPSDWKGKTIAQEDLDFLVTIFVWGKDKYELANFTDEELANALTQYASERRNRPDKTPTWQDDLRVTLQYARSRHLDIGVVFKRLGLREGKQRFAEILLPVLMDKFALEMSSGVITTPVIELVQNVHMKVNLLSGASYSLRS